ncbi:DUF2079 domain-containing protein [bacterium]|nr:DUF2079 domain-containing protein [bacterium]
MKKNKKRTHHTSPKATGMTQNQKYTTGVLFMMLTYIIVITLLAIRRFESFTPATYDLGIMLQAVWNTANGWLLQESINMGYPMMRFWMAHWEFIYVVAAGFYKVFSTPYTLLVFQTVIVALGALPVYWLGRDVFKNSSVGLTFAMVYLLFPAMQNANLFDVHGVTLAAPFLIYCFYFLYSRKFKLFTLFSIIALSCREDAALLLIMMGVYAFFFLKERKAGFWTIVLPALYFLIWFKRMQIRTMLGLPEYDIMAGADTHWSHMAQTKDVWWYPIQFLAKKVNILYFIALLGPVAFFSILSPETLLIAAPVLALNLFSSYHYTHLIQHHYSAVIVPFVLISAILGARRIFDWVNKKWGPGKKQRDFRENVISGLLFLLIICSIVFFFKQSNVFDYKKWEVTDHHKNIKSVIAEIPADASVSALNAMGPHIANRHEAYVFADNVDEVDFVLYDFYAPKYTFIDRTSFFLPFGWPINQRIDSLLINLNYGIVQYRDGVVLFQKDADYVAGLKKLTYAAGAEVRHFKHIKMTPDFDFAGYNWHTPVERGFNMEKIDEAYLQYMLHFTAFYSVSAAVNPADSLLYKITGDGFVAEFHHVPVFGLMPMHQWSAGELVRDEVFWLAPKDLVKGTYIVSAVLNPASEQAVPDYHEIFEFEF